ncbi:MAG: hypothetical protein E7587_03510 [Ruminococcaceae bacterium]|nr:hypothetical protein [Oscillospiraceae bacterium]
MIRTLAALFAVAAILLCLCSCFSQDTLPELSRTSRIEIRAFSSTEQAYTDYTISDEASVREICDTLSSLELKKIKLTEPLAQSYALTFYYPNGGRIGSVTLVSGHNVVDCGDMYKIKNDVDINVYISEFIPQK